MLFLKQASPGRKEHSSHAFLAGLTGGYLVFGRGIQSSVNQQIVIYVFARVVLALAKLSVQRRSEGGVGMGREWRERVRGNAWPVFASLSWAGVMWVFRWYPESVQPSLRSSMKYMWVVPSFPFLLGLFLVRWFAALRMDYLCCTKADTSCASTDTWTPIIGTASGRFSSTTNRSIESGYESIALALMKYIIKGKAYQITYAASTGSRLIFLL